jgi:hypothetical protein
MSRSNIAALTRRSTPTSTKKKDVIQSNIVPASSFPTYVQPPSNTVSVEQEEEEEEEEINRNSSIHSSNTTRCPRYYNEVDHATYLIDSCCKNYNQCNDLEQELESAKSKCNMFLKRNNITGFATDENNQVIDNNSVCGLLHSRISQIKATKELFVQNYIDVIEFIRNAVNKSDAINNDNKYGIIFEDGMIQNTKNVFLKKIHNPKPISLHIALLEQAGLAANSNSYGNNVFKYYLGVGGKKQTRRKINKKRTNKKKSKTNKKKSKTNKKKSNKKK